MSIPVVRGAATARTIPWEFSEAGDNYVQYAWRSDPYIDANGRFVATVIYDGTTWAWRVESLAPGHGGVLGAGTGPERDYCQEMAVECVGKSFDSAAPHHGLATAASHRYTLAEGNRVDLSKAAGERATLTLRDGQTRHGVLMIGGHYLSLRSEDRVVHVPPSEVTSVTITPAAHR
jgi:hypothetical protein